MLVLIADDHLDSLWALSVCLENEGYRVVVAENGEAALRLALAEPPDIVLLDLEMPVMSGLEFVERQQLEPTLRCVPVICLSARYDAPQHALRLGLAGCHVKPADPRKLLADVRRLCRAA